MESLRGKVAVITGSSSGIGTATALLFAKHGCRLTIHGRNKPRIDKVVNQCKACGLTDDQVLAVTADLSKEDDVTRLMEETMKHFGTINILVNNAAIAIGSSFETLNLKDFDKTINVNLRSIVQLCQLALPHLKQNKGCIVNVSSNCSTRPFAPATAYAVAKAGLDMLNASLAIELGPYGIRVNSVNPGATKTPIHQLCGLVPGDMEQYWKDRGASFPLEFRVGEPEEVAQSIAFLASDAASFVSGSALVIDGAQSQTSGWYVEEAAFLKQLREQGKKIGQSRAVTISIL